MASSKPLTGVAVAALLASLPACATRQYPKVSMDRGTPVVLEGIVRGARELTEYHESFLRDHPEDYLVTDGSIVPRYGIYLADIAELLARKAPTAGSMKCEEAE